MLENIKNIFFKRNLLFHINEKRKLKLIKYNRCIQNDLDISLINYIYFSKRYIIYEAKNQAKEYDYFDQRLIYEGEYLHGERYGKGKEYDYGKLIYEGEYLHGERNGKGKEYRYPFSRKNQKLNFEGEYLNGKMWNGKIYGPKIDTFSNLKDGKGFIKEYSGDDCLKFEGSYLNGDKHGHGKEYSFGKLFFEGEYLNGLRNGKGKE